ncbi:hypothetical protein LINPERHAP2_LOCUS34191, partial [Linum perenne]
MSREEVFEHLICIGFLQNYTHWVMHGESAFHASPSMSNQDHDNEVPRNDMEDLLNDMVRSVQSEAGPEEPNVEALKFYKLVEANQTELYPGCTSHSKLSFIIRLFHVKCLGKWQHLSYLRRLHPRATPHNIQVKHNATFQSWFSNEIISGTNASMENCEELRDLARSPNNVVRKFNGFIINGY